MPALLRKPSQRNLLSYPAGMAAGFDPNHIAAQAMQFSGIAHGANFVDLTTGAKGTLGGVPTYVLDGIVGPTTKFSSTAMQTTFAGKSAVASASYTIAVILVPDSVAGTQYLLNSSTASGGVSLRIINSTQLALAVNGGSQATLTVPTMVVGTPYFIAVSGFHNGTTLATNIVVVNLQTGSVATTSATPTITAPTADAGTCTVGNRGASFANNIHMSCAMYSLKTLSLTQLKQWASDPWSFWYPRTIDLTQIMSPAVAVGGSFLAAWASQSNLPVLGTGTY